MLLPLGALPLLRPSVTPLPGLFRLSWRLPTAGAVGYRSCAALRLLGDQRRAAIHYEPDCSKLFCMEVCNERPGWRPSEIGLETETLTQTSEYGLSDV